MATSKSAPKKTRKKAPNAKGRAGGSRRTPPAFARAREVLLAVLTRETVGVFLLVCGVFFSAAFVTGRGAFLGEAGHVAATRFLGVVGLALAPLLALAGLLVLVRRLPVRGVIGVVLVLAAAAATLAARLPDRRLFDADRYVEAGGIVGSGVFSAIFSVGGAIGAVLVVGLLYAVGLSLLTGVTFGAALTSSRDAGRGAAERLRGWRENRAAARADSRSRVEASGSDAQEASRGASGGAWRVPYGRHDEDEGSGPVSGAELRDHRAGGTREAPVVRDLHGELEEPGPSGAPDPKPRPAEEKTKEFEVVVPEPPAAAPPPPGGLAVPGGPPGEGALPAGGDGLAVDGEYAPPPFTLLDRGRGEPEHNAEETSRRLTEALASLGVEAQVIRAVVGPRVTRYELRLGSGVKVGKVRNLQQDIAYALAATEVRILAPIPGKSAVGVEVPNTRPAKVTLGDVFAEYPEGNDWTLPVGLGKDISGRAVFFDLADMPHLLVAGTTGSGKSVMLNALLTSLLLATDPRQVKMVLIDPKRVELSQYGRIPHLITPVVTDVKKAANALGWAVAEMERRYEVLEKAGSRSLEGYNQKVEVPMPYVVLVIDELADLMMQAASKVEDAVIRIAQKARAVGIHLVVATQRPSVDVITGMIKANIPSRIAFAVSSQVDSRVILDSPGAESLLGMGDMLFKPVSALRSSRVQGAFISEGEVERVVEGAVAASKGRVEANFVEEVTEAPQEAKGEPEEPEDDLLPDAADFVVASQQASVSAVQRRFRVGYSRAGRIIDALERKGVVGPYEGSKSRAVKASPIDLDSIFGEGDAEPADTAPRGAPNGAPNGSDEEER